LIPARIHSHTPVTFTLGLVTQTQLLSALWRGHIAEQITLSGA
jgi:hypothetical protein